MDVFYLEEKKETMFISRTARSRWVQLTKICLHDTIAIYLHG